MVAFFWGRGLNGPLLRRGKGKEGLGLGCKFPSSLFLHTSHIQMKGDGGREEDGGVEKESFWQEKFEIKMTSFSLVRKCF